MSENNNLPAGTKETWSRRDILDWLQRDYNCSINHIEQCHNGKAVEF